MKKTIFNLFHIPYYHALIVKHGDVVSTAIVRQKGNVKSFRVKSLRATFILPDDRKSGIPPIKVKNGRLIVYDVNSAIPMKLVSHSDEGIEWMDEDMRKQYAVNPKQFYLTPLDTEELHTFLEARVTDDILAGDEKEVPWWLVTLIICVVAVIGLVAVVYMVTHGTPTTITEYIPFPTPTVTPTPIPGIMKPGV